MLIADLHIHSRYSRATSSQCTPEHLDLWARRKGIHLLGTGAVSYTHLDVYKRQIIPLAVQSLLCYTGSSNVFLSKHGRLRHSKEKRRTLQ